MAKHGLLQLKGIAKSYKQKNSEVTILDNINLEIAEGEVVGILGRSGSGKSTLLRIISSLIEPSSGNVLYNHKPIAEVDPKTAMVFQSFALIPWLTVFDNIALGLEEQDLPKIVIREKVIKAINLVGLSGYEEAYPKEMSGGMRQRVGFARALVIDPEILLMDEPFSALDYLTANALKQDLLSLWSDHNRSSIKVVVLVTHSIEEAVKLCDRVIVLSSNPGKVIANVTIDLAHPRDEASMAFHEKLDSLYVAMTSTSSVHEHHAEHDLHKYYPQAISVMNLFHFMLSIKEHAVHNHAKLKKLATALKLNNGQLVAFVDALSLLKFVEVNHNDITLSVAGQNLLDADDEGQKKIFREQLVKHVSYISNICDLLHSCTETHMSKQELLSILEQKFNHEEAMMILTATISWARYADLFSYDDIKEELRIDQHFIINS